MAATSAPKARSKVTDQAVCRALATCCRELSSHRLRTAAWSSVALVGVAVALASFALQKDFANRYQAGAALTGWQNFLRLGDPWQALIPPLAAAALAILGWRSLQVATPQPTFGFPHREHIGVTELRSMLRRERSWMVTLVDAVTGLVLIALVRLPVYLVLAAAGSRLALATTPGIALEAVAWAACGGSFWIWRNRYRSTMESWGIRDAS